MLKEYTIKLTVQVGGDGEGDCDDKLHLAMEVFEETQWEITHEEVLHNEEVERVSAIGLQNHPTTHPVRFKGGC